MEKWYQSKTVWGGVTQVVAGVAGLLTGQVDPNGAVALIIAGAYQIIQRVAALKKADQAGA